MKRTFEIRTYVLNKYNDMELLVLMDLETYNEALANHIEHVRDDCFNDGFEAGQCPYPSEEELADMDDDRAKDNSQKDNS